MVKHIPYMGDISIYASVDLKIASEMQWKAHYQVPITFESIGTHGCVRIMVEGTGMSIPFHALDRIYELKKSLEVELPDWIDSKTRVAFEGIANTGQLRRIKHDYEHGGFLDDPLAIEFVNGISSKMLRELQRRAADRGLSGEVK